MAALPGQVDDVSSLVKKRSGAAVKLGAVLARAGVRAEATHLTVESADGTFSASVPLAGVRDVALLVYREDDEPLSSSKGGPVRLLIPDAAACRTAEIDTCANVKFVATLTLTVGPGRDTRPATPRSHKKLHETPGHEHLDES